MCVTCCTKLLGCQRKKTHHTKPHNPTIKIRESEYGNTVALDKGQVIQYINLHCIQLHYKTQVKYDNFINLFDLFSEDTTHDLSFTNTYKNSKLSLGLV